MSWFQDFTSTASDAAGALNPVSFAASEASNVLSSLVDNLFYSSKLKKQVKAQKELTDYQNNASLQMMTKAAEAQKQGMKNAGLNVASGQYSGNVSSSSPSVSSPSVQNNLGKAEAADLARQQARLQDKNEEVADSAIRKNDADAALSNAQAEKVSKEAGFVPQIYKDLHARTQVEIRSMNQSIEESLSRIGVNDAQRVSLIRAADNYAASTRKIFEEINMMPSQIREILSRVNLNYVNARKADADTELSKVEKMLTEKRKVTEIWQHRLQAQDLENMKNAGVKMVYELEQMRKYYGSDKFFQYFGQVVGGVATGVSAASSFKYLSGKGSQNYAPSRVPYPDNTARTFYTDY